MELALKKNRRRIRVVIADDHKMVRVGIKSMIESDPSIRVVADAGTIAEAVTALAVHRPDVLVLDMRFRDGKGAVVCRHIRRQFPDTAILLLISSPEDSMPAEAFVCGAMGYLTMDISGPQLIAAVKNVARGEVVVPPSALGLMVRRRHRGARRQARGRWLSHQQQRVLALVANGLTNKEIGKELGLSDKTVRNYLYRLYKKWGVKGR
ncbi:MAG TPA: response regulator transcription factor, partial [Nitrospira sp.]|nr:response regulator transcription factor [Nitrospira sp.]